MSQNMNVNRFYVKFVRDVSIQVFIKESFIQ